jgi:hypothetical protein
MKRKIIAILVVMGFCFGCVTDWQQGQKSSQPSTYVPAKIGEGESALVFDPFEIDTYALPDMRDLPVPARVKKKARAYTGIIKNKTRYDVVVPSGNSAATLTIPANGWIEYTSWSRRFDLTAYHDGKPFYCLKINASPRDYAFMCSKYDFMVEIVKEEPLRKTKPAQRKRPGREKPQGDGVEGLG